MALFFFSDEPVLLARSHNFQNIVDTVEGEHPDVYMTHNPYSRTFNTARAIKKQQQAAHAVQYKPIYFHQGLSFHKYCYYGFSHTPSKRLCWKQTTQAPSIQNTLEVWAAHTNTHIQKHTGFTFLAKRWGGSTEDISYKERWKKRNNGGVKEKE